jgi:hypothetical protein
MTISDLEILTPWPSPREFHRANDGTGGRMTLSASAVYAQISVHCQLFRCDPIAFQLPIAFHLVVRRRRASTIAIDVLQRQPDFDEFLAIMGWIEGWLRCRWHQACSENQEW